MFPVVKKADSYLASGVRGKRRLGRFPVSSTSVVVRKDTGYCSFNVDIGMCEDAQTDEDLVGVSFSPLSSPMNSSYLNEIEKVESAINLGCEPKINNILKPVNNKVHFKQVEAVVLSNKQQHVNNSENKIFPQQTSPLKFSQIVNFGYSPTKSPKDKKIKFNDSSSRPNLKMPNKKMSNTLALNIKSRFSSKEPIDQHIKKAESTNKTVPSKICLNALPNSHTNQQGSAETSVPTSNVKSCESKNVKSLTKALETSLKQNENTSLQRNALEFNKLDCSRTVDCINTLHKSSESLSLTEDKRLLSSWGLPKPVLEVYKEHGIETMFEWQAECLLTGNALESGNLVYSAPTSAGKTLVAELLVLKKVLESRKKAIIILPFVAVAREKMYQLQNLYQDIGVRVGGFMGSNSPSGGLTHVDIAVCTIEKANGLLNRLMEEGRIGELGIVVVDELHMVGDSHRGYLLELMFTKLMYLTSKNNSTQDRLQIIGMSATLPNLQLLADWLKASLYFTDCRPVPLTEYIKVDNKILSSDLFVQREIPASLTFPNDQDHIVALSLETVTTGHAVLIFCPTKVWCENLCEVIAKHFFQILKYQREKKTDGNEKVMCHDLKLSLDDTSLLETVEQLKRCPAGADHMLSRCIMNGVAYHHAGLTFDEREIIEGAFRESHLKVLVATSTLSSGVNLPAQRVIIRTPMFHGHLLDSMTYKQMAGRAGRRGIDKYGESILICKSQEKVKGQILLKAALPYIQSCLHFNVNEGLSNSLKRAILEVVVSGVANCYEDVLAYIDCTLLSASLSDNDEQLDKKSLIESCIQYLQENEFITVHLPEIDGVGDGAKKLYYSTQLGAAILASSLSPDEGLQVFAELQKARKSFVLDTDLHLIYLVTPVYNTDISSSIDWYAYHALWEALSPADRRVAQLVGVSEAFIGRAIKGSIPNKTITQKKSLAVHQRFYQAMILNSLIQETPLIEVATKFNCNKGQLQSLQQSVSTYAGMMTVLCGKLGWYNLELLLSHFQKRLSSGVQQELVDLVRIEAVNACSARMLFNAGYHTVADVARAEVIDVANLFKKAAPFQSEKKEEGETEWEQQERNRARCIWLTGRKGVSEMEAAITIIREAKLIIQDDLGVPDIDWDSKKQSSNADEASEHGEVNSECYTAVQSSQHCPSTAVDNVACSDSKVSKGEASNVSANVFTDDSMAGNFNALNMVVAESKTPLSNLSMRKSQVNIGSSAITTNKKSHSFFLRESKKTSDKRKSFFGQVVVSPPVSLRIEKRLSNETCSIIRCRESQFFCSYSSLSPQTAGDHLSVHASCERSSKNVYQEVSNNSLDGNIFEESLILDTQTENLIHQLCPSTQGANKQDEHFNNSYPKLDNVNSDGSCKYMQVSKAGHNLVPMDVGDVSMFSDSFNLSTNLPSESKTSGIMDHFIQKEIKCVGSSNANQKEQITNYGPVNRLSPSPVEKTTRNQSSYFISSVCEENDVSTCDSLIAASNFEKFGDLAEVSDISLIDNSDTSEVNEANVRIKRQIISTTSIRDIPNSAVSSPLNENIFLSNFTPIGSASSSVTHKTDAHHSTNLAPHYSTPKITENSRLHHKAKLIDLGSRLTQTKKLLSQKLKMGEEAEMLNLSFEDKMFQDSFTYSVMDKVQAECDHMLEENHLMAEDLPGILASPVHLQSKTNISDVSGSDNSDCISSTPPDVSTKPNSPFIHSYNSPFRLKPRLTKNCSTSTDGTDPNAVDKNFTKLKEKPKGAADGVAALDGTNSRYQQPTDMSNCEKKMNDGGGDRFRFLSQHLTQQSFTIIDVCANKDLFETFLKEWSSKTSYALSIACDKMSPELACDIGPSIGGKFVKTSKKKENLQAARGLPVAGSSSVLTGLAISWENRDSYYISLMPDGHKNCIDTDDILAEPDIDSKLPLKLRIESVCKVFETCTGQKVASYDVKTVYKYLAKTLGVSLVNCEDPRIADWLREPTSRLKNLHRMIASHCPEELALLDCVGGIQGYQSLGADTKSQVPARVRACTESVLTMKLMTRFYSLLADDHLLSVFTDVEMPSLITLARMELNGFGISCGEIDNQKSLMLNKLKDLEEKAYSLAGHVFSLTSLNDISKVLYLELKLPINGDPNKVARLTSVRSKGSAVGSTSKETLEKLASFHPLPTVILEWRKLSSAMSKSLFALQKAARASGYVAGLSTGINIWLESNGSGEAKTGLVDQQWIKAMGQCPVFLKLKNIKRKQRKNPLLHLYTAKTCCKLNMQRVFGDCQVFTATGRVSMAEPNIQNIPKDFSCQLTESDSVMHSKAGKTTPVSMRTMFIPFTGGVLLAADYCQLELRIFAHLCDDSQLLSVLNLPGVDVFNIIAAQMKCVDVDSITEQYRQQAKQVCYGMLYGMGPKALGEQMSLDENDAYKFIETFKNKYPGIRKYLKETVAFCQKNGFVKTIFNRRRYLPFIKSPNIHIRAQAERQAVNTTIQGSAADLVKVAMVNIDQSLKQMFPSTRFCHTQISRLQMLDARGQIVRGESKVEGAYLVLQLHDELIYEVSAHLLPQVSRLIKKQMESAIKLNVCLPVKVKVGPSWGQLKDYQLD